MKQTSVYVITEKGNTCGTKAKKHIQEILAENHGVTNELWFVMGAINNDLNGYKAALKKYPDSYTILSLPDDLIILTPECNDEIIENIDNNNDKTKTTWQLLNELYSDVE